MIGFSDGGTRGRGCVLLDADPQVMVGLGAGADTAMLGRKRTVVTQALRRTCAVHGAALRDPLVALAALGGPEFAVLAGVVLGAAAAGAVVVLDGLATSVAALLVVHSEPAAAACLVVGQRSLERGHEPVLTHLGCEPLLDLRIRAGEGVGAWLAATVIRQGPDDPGRDPPRQLLDTRHRDIPSSRYPRFSDCVNES